MAVKHIHFFVNFNKMIIFAETMMEMSLPDTLSLMRINSLNYEKLKGDKKGLSSVRVNDQYRIEFEEYTVDGQSVATICNITELSNHYK